MNEQPEALRLAELIDDHAPIDFDGHLAQAAAELRRLHAENEALRKDAERYRWLRETRFIWGDFRHISGVNPTAVGLEFGWFPTDAAKPARADLDAAIDAAMKGQP